MKIKIAFFLAFSVALTGCATVNFADGKTVSLRDEGATMEQLQSQANAACLGSGGKAPAVLISHIPLHNALPAALVAKVATYRCA